MSFTVSVLRGIDSDGAPRIRALSFAEDGTESYAPCEAGLESAWARLARVSTIDAGSLADLRAVLESSLPDPETKERTVDRLTVPNARDVRGTAAHPRAYRGTKHKLPKPPLDSRDLRFHLLSRRGEREVLRWVTTEAPDALPTDPYLLRWHGNGQVDRNRLPPVFVRELLYSLRGEPWSGVREAAAVFRRMSLDSRQAARRTIALALATTPVGLKLAWLRLFEAIPESRVPRFVRAVRASKANRLAPSDQFPAAESAAALGLASYEQRLLAVLKTHEVGAPLAYVTAGLELQHRFQERWDLVGPLEGPGGMVPWVERLLGSTRDYEHSRQAYRVFRAAGSLGEFRELIDRLPDQARAPMAIVLSAIEARGADAEIWRAATRVAVSWAGALVSLPETHREKGEALLEQLVLQVDAKEAQRRFAVMPSLLDRVCRPPFADVLVTPVLGRAPLQALIESLPLAHLETLLATPDASLLKLETLSQRDGPASLAREGLAVLAAELPSFTVHALAFEPSRLLRSARALGLLSTAVALEVIRRFEGHDLVRLDLASMTLEAMVEAIDQARPRSVHNPVSARLRAHVEGRARLRPGQIERDRAQAERGLLASRVELLGFLVTEHAQRRMGTKSVLESDERLALMVVLDIDENRRALRRAIRRWLGSHALGQMGTRVWGRESHPANRSWLKRHSGLETTWLNGIRRVFEADGRELVLALETDPIQILQVGTWTGTCTGLGGYLIDGLASLVLDVNRQVVVAKDALGRVARQVLSISKKNELVPCAPYPLSTSSAVRAAFRSYDAEFAQSLGIAVSLDSYPEFDRLVATHPFHDDTWIEDPEKPLPDTGPR
ncbi:MAG: hypothetical protein HY791_23250 [Deltaproteobacteria bacterium]|nr:hypothetical protein [Deltaproteobacteria bacterium]